jgi:TctA family transporter
MAISGGDPTVFVTRPLTAVILAGAVAAVSTPVLTRYLARRRAGD